MSSPKRNVSIYSRNTEQNSNLWNNVSHTQRHHLHLYELELARQELIRDYTPQLTRVTETIHSLQPTSEVRGTSEYRLLTKLETIQHHIHQLRREK